MAVCGVYVFVLSIDLITQFIGGKLLNMMPVITRKSCSNFSIHRGNTHVEHETFSLQMFLFSSLGVIFFAIVAFYLLLVSRPLMCHLITMGALSIIAVILFITDVSLIFV